MKTITFIRHGKSSWDLDIDDLYRPLAQRGLRDANKVAHHYIKYALSIDAVYSSHAHRALNTALIMLEIWGMDLNRIEIKPLMYDFSGENIMQFIKTVPNNLEHIVIFGHNHALTHVTNLLGNQKIEVLPTAGLTRLTFDTNEWAEIKKGTTHLILFPKQLL